MINALKGKKALVYGYGISGKAAAKLLAEKGAKVYVYDDKKVESEFLQATNPSELLSSLDLVVASPSVRPDCYILKRAKEEGIEVIGELELAYAFCDSEIVAVTGTNGKTTVCKMIAETVEASGRRAETVGNYGVAFSEKVSDLGFDDVAVVEASSFQLSLIDGFEPEIALLLNVKPDHLDYHGGFGEYVEAKAAILKNQTKRDAAIFNFDDAESLALAAKSRANNYYFSKKTRVRGAFVEKNVIYFEDEHRTEIMNVEDLQLEGAHNLENALAAVAAAMLLGINPKIIASVLKRFRLPDFRMRFTGEKAGKRFYNDSKGTNVSATLAAVGSVEGETLLILGGSDKGENFDELFSRLPDNVVRILVTGANADKIIDSAIRLGRTDVSYRSTLKECVTESFAFWGKNVVFSPSSASFDKFSDYVERGRAFDKYFSELPDA